MWWLLVPVVGAVVTAIVSSSSDDESPSSGSCASRESAEREAREKEKHRAEEALQQDITEIARVGLQKLLHDHPMMLQRSQPNNWDSLTFSTLERSLQESATNANSFSKLRRVLPDIEYLGASNTTAKNINILEKEISQLIALSLSIQEHTEK